MTRCVTFFVVRYFDEPDSCKDTWFFKACDRFFAATRTKVNRAFSKRLQLKAGNIMFAGHLIEAPATNYGIFALRMLVLFMKLTDLVGSMISPLSGINKLASLLRHGFKVGLNAVVAETVPDGLPISQDAGSCGGYITAS